MHDFYAFVANLVSFRFVFSLDSVCSLLLNVQGWLVGF